MVGSFSVGKTSLVARYVESIFSDTYLTTVGVKISKKIVPSASGQLNLILWDVAGEDDSATIRMSYLRGSAGYVVVADGTRAKTLDAALSLRTRIQAEFGPLPMLLLLNKCDLIEHWTVTDGEIAALANDGLRVIRCSAKTGEGVEVAFAELATAVVA
jgi:small GTP-binding protein